MGRNDFEFNFWAASAHSYICYKIIGSSGIGDARTVVALKHCIFMVTFESNDNVFDKTQVNGFTVGFI